MDVSGQLARTVAAPQVERVGDWRYVAVEFQADAVQAKVWLASGGLADFYDIALAPVANSYLGNRNVQPDGRGRIGFWDEEKEDSIGPGKRAGTRRSDPTTKRRDLPSLMVESTGDWYAVSSVNYTLPTFTDRIELSGWARSDAGATAQILACWMDDIQKVIRVEGGPETHGNDWQRLRFVLDAPPERACTVRLVALPCLVRRIRSVAHAATHAGAAGVCEPGGIRGCRAEECSRRQQLFSYNGNNTRSAAHHIRWARGHGETSSMRGADSWRQVQ
jgi:hypothetical protein